MIRVVDGEHIDGVRKPNESMAAYLDHNATTSLDPVVRQAMEPWLNERFGNPSSRDHSWGWDAMEVVEESRALIAGIANVEPHAVVFVSSATEGLNAVLRGYFGFSGWTGKSVVTGATEHDSVLSPARYLSRRTGSHLQVLPVDKVGGIDSQTLLAAIESRPGALVALMAANNEIGTLHPVREIAAAVHSAGGLLLCDTAQAFGRVPVDFRADGIDFATISAHKIHGPKGAGALVVRDGLENELQPLILGGGQERGLRGGTLNVPGVVGLGEACRLVQEHLDDDADRMNCLRNRLEDGILSQVPHTWVNGDRANRLCNTTNIGFKSVEALTMIRDMNDIAVSTRSACSSGNSGPSHVLKAIGLSDDDAYSSIRFSLGRFTTEAEIEYAINKVVMSADKLRRNKSVRM